MNNSKLTVTNISIIFLGAIIGIIHLIQPDLVLKLNGAGYIALIAVMFLPYASLNHYRASAKQGLLVYTFVTMMMFFLVHQGEAFDQSLGLMTKGFEVALATMLTIELQKQNKPKSYRF